MPVYDAETETTYYEFFEYTYYEQVPYDYYILTIAFGGIVYTPGSAGTVQEIFQDATQNHYLSFGYSSPMIFYNKEFWTKEMPVYQFLLDMMETGRYKNLLLHLTDNDDEIINIVKAFSQEK